MKIRYSKRFTKQLAKQPTNVEKAFKLRILLFQENMHDPMLRNHPLKGEFKGYYSINITGDVRALYEIIEDEIYLYDVIGSHSQLYG
ncbi:MAG: type II toxin-antitoxin system mRNA interferase toxin, RelE/StbE family [Candidatus Saccharimonadales bacterium]